MEQFILRFRQFKILQIFTIYLRYLIGGGFTFAALVKIKGERFTNISVEEPVGFFFEAMFQTGLYWQFLGWMQLLGAFLLMTQRFATIGAILFFAVIMNIFMITISVDFGSGTPVITGLMLLATVYLLLWDFPKLKLLLYQENQINVNYKVQNLSIMNDKWWAGLGLLLFVLSVVFGWTRYQMLVWVVLCLGLGAGGLLIFFYNKKR